MPRDSLLTVQWYIYFVLWGSVSSLGIRISNASESLTSTEPKVMGMGSTNSLGVLLGMMGSRIIPAFTLLVPSPMNFSYQRHCSPEDGAPFLQSIGSELALKHVFTSNSKYLTDPQLGVECDKKPGEFHGHGPTLTFPLL